MAIGRFAGSLTACLAAALFSLLVCSPAAAASLQEASWHRVGKPSHPDLISLEFYVALNQRNLDILEATLLDVSDPKSTSFGKYLTKEQILEVIAPSAEESSPVVQWLRTGNVEILSSTEARFDVLKARASVSDIERLFGMPLFLFKEARTGRYLIRHEVEDYSEYKIPSHLRKVVDFVFGLSEFPQYLPKQRKLRSQPISVSSGIVVPWVINQFYSIPFNMSVHPNSSVAAVELEDDRSFSEDDLKLFEEKNNLFVTKNVTIVGPYNPVHPDGESTLDVQIIAGVANNASIWFWTSPNWMYTFAVDFFTNETIPYVISISWGWTERYQCTFAKCKSPKRYIDRTNAELLKITTRGVSIFVSSGDQGAPGDSNSQCGNFWNPLTTDFPTSSPYVTSVGATMLWNEPRDSTVGYYPDEPPLPPACTEKNNTCPTPATATEVVCSIPWALITSSGGFSRYTEQPTWQAKAVSQYLNSGVPLPPAQFFNASKRAVPDVSALGHNFYVIQGLKEQLYDGTSASSPLWAAVTALLNSIRFDLGKSPLGFVNQILYTLAEESAGAFFDITAGDNFCTESACCKYGFYASKGYDLATGLGSPNFTEIANYISQLP